MGLVSRTHVVSQQCFNCIRLPGRTIVVHVLYRGRFLYVVSGQQSVILRKEAREPARAEASSS